MMQEEIQKYADKLGQEYFPNECNIWARENLEAKFVSEACMRMSKFTKELLINKVCEQLQNIVDDDVLVKCGNVIKCMDTNEFSEYFKNIIEK